MSIATLATFGSGGAEPYARALRQDGQVLYLRESGSTGVDETSVMPMWRWRDDADTVDLSLLRGSTGSVIDIGCGPGRMVKAARGLGRPALGIDVSPAVVAIGLEAGLSIERHSVFDPLPNEGGWETALLIDGNIGIGGEVTALLARCREILRTGGEVIVEVHDDPTRDRQYDGTVTDIHGDQSAAFPWAEIGRDPLADRARHAGLAFVQSWAIGGRCFCRLATRP